MSNIITEIQKAEKGSDIYSLIEKVAERISLEEPSNTDIENWFKAQKMINDFLIEDKLAEKIAMTYSEKDEQTCIDEAREILSKINLDKESIEELAHEGISLDKIINCNLRYYSNQFYMHRRNKENSNEIQKTFDDWKKALECVAENISVY